MAGFAAALGGAAAPLQQYGQQMRGILEDRRSHFVDLALQRAKEAGDDEERDMWIGAANKALAGKDFGSFLPQLIKQHDTQQQNTQNLGALAQQLMPAAPAPPAPPPSTGSGLPGGFGISPGPAGSAFASLLGPSTPAPAPPPAAQPATAAVPTTAQPIQVPASIPAQAPVGAVNAPIPTIAALNNATTAPPVATMASVGAPTDLFAMRNQITDDYHQRYKLATQAMRPIVEAEMKAKLDALAPFEQIAQRKSQLEAIQQTPEYKNASDYAKLSLIAQANGFQPITQPQGALVPNKTASTVASLSPEIRKQFGLEKLPDTFPITISKNRLDNSIIDVVPGNPGIGVTTDENGNQHYTQKIGGTDAGVAPATVTDFKGAGVDLKGHPIFINPFHSNLNFTGTGVNPAFIQSQSTTTTQTPGQLPTTSHVVKTKGGTTGPITAITGGAASPAIKAVTGSSPSPAAVATDPLTAEKYKEWTAGGPAPTGKDLSAVQMYAQANGLPTPNAMSASGQKNLQAIDTVLQQIKDIKAAMEEKKLQNDESRGYYSDYLKYTHAGEATPLQDLWTKMNFEGIRSAATALAGVNSRALPIINRAFEHVPNPQASLTHLPDTPKLMYGKLKSMEDMLTKGRQDILNDEKKSGVVTNGPTPIVAAPMTPIIGKTYTQSDVDAAVKGHPGMTTDQIDKAFKDKGYIKK